MSLSFYLKIIVFLDFLLKEITEAPEEQALIYCRMDLPLGLKVSCGRTKSIQATLCLQWAGIYHITQKYPS